MLESIKSPHYDNKHPVRTTWREHTIFFLFIQVIKPFELPKQKSWYIKIYSFRYNTVITRPLEFPAEIFPPEVIITPKMK